jgi:hypothetical protein
MEGCRVLGPSWEKVEMGQVPSFSLGHPFPLCLAVRISAEVGVWDVSCIINYCGCVMPLGLSQGYGCRHQCGWCCATSDCSGPCRLVMKS